MSEKRTFVWKHPQNTSSDNSFFKKVLGILLKTLYQTRLGNVQQDFRKFPTNKCHANLYPVQASHIKWHIQLARDICATKNV